MDLGPVDRITTDAIGEPGARVFYIQARAGVELVTVIVEKQQVQLLAASVLELLEDAPRRSRRGGAGGRRPDPLPRGRRWRWRSPLDPRWRAGRLSIGFDQDRDLFLLEVEEFQPDLEDLDEDDPRSIVPESRRRVRSRNRSGSGRRRRRCWRSRGTERRSPHAAGRRASSAATRSTRRATRVPR